MSYGFPTGIACVSQHHLAASPYAAKVSWSWYLSRQVCNLVVALEVTPVLSFYGSSATTSLQCFHSSDFVLPRTCYDSSAANLELNLSVRHALNKIISYPYMQFYLHGVHDNGVQLRVLTHSMIGYIQL